MKERNVWEEAAYKTRWFQSAVTYAESRPVIDPFLVNRLREELYQAENEELKAHIKLSNVVGFSLEPDE